VPETSSRGIRTGNFSCRTYDLTPKCNTVAYSCVSANSFISWSSDNSLQKLIYVQSFTNDFTIAAKSTDCNRLTCSLSKRYRNVLICTNMMVTKITSWYLSPWKPQISPNVRVDLLLHLLFFFPKLLQRLDLIICSCNHWIYVKWTPCDHRRLGRSSVCG
jgi:hypothetical protein